MKTSERLHDVALTLLPIVVIILIVWALVDLAKRRPAHGVMWTVLIVLLPVLGAIGYLIAGRKQPQ